MSSGKHVATGRPRKAARQSSTLPGNRWEFLGWICDDWNRWLRAVSLAMIVLFCLLLLGSAGRQAIAVVLSR
jgi:hypothetical protein